ncbi:O-acetyltransferase (cell wall biosynthesis) [Bacillus thuringiensis serovar israelensis ATCC 35646]|nr:O-acetyltransferase (cell wall biosynthesis) [Bacillus thuringiensis serovar israelensis ATCC 35646]
MNSFYSQEELKKIGFLSVGKNVLISKKASIYNPGAISIGNHVRIDDFCILSGKITIGSYSHISAVYSVIWRGSWD